MQLIDTMCRFEPAGNVHLSNTIRKLRFDHGEMTQRELAKRVGVSRQTICSIENGKHSPSLELAIRIADVFRETVDDVFTFDYEDKPDFLVIEIDLGDPPDR